MSASLRCNVLISAFIALVAVGAGRPTQVTGQEMAGSVPPYAAIGAAKYSGPARASTFDLSGDVIRIGILASLHGPEKADGDAIVLAARMSLEEASRRPFPNGKRIELAVADEFGPSWGQTGDALLRLVANEQAIAVVTSSNGATAHLSEQVGNRIGVPILTLSTDPTTTEIDLPWIFRLGPSDSQLADAMVQDAARRHRLHRIIFVAENNHDGRVGARVFQKAAERDSGVSIDCIFIDPLRPEFDSVMAELSAQPADAFVLWTRPQAAQILLTQIQRAGINTPVYLSPQAAQESLALDHEQLDLSCDKATESGCVWMADWRSQNVPARMIFEKKFEEQTGHSPSPVAAGAYDAVALIAEAVRATGPNRARVRDWLAKVKGFSGVSGGVSFNGQGNNAPNIRLVRLAID